MVVLGATCALAAGCAFDPRGTTAAGGDDDHGGMVDAAGLSTVDASPPPGGADAAPPPPPPPGTAGVLHCRRTAISPRLDGHLDDWPSPGGAQFDMTSAAQVLDKTALYLPSMAADVSCAHDGSNIYFAARVLDERRVVDSPNLYDDDAVLLYLDARGDANGVFAADDHEIVVRADNMWHDYAQGSAAVALDGQVLPGMLDQGFTVEIEISKASLGAGAVLPTQLGFDVALTDDDGFGAYAYGLWFLSSRPSCAACCPSSPGARAWCDTTTFGTLVLD